MIDKFLENVTSGNNDCVVLLSSGADSNSILASLLRNNRKPLVTSFRLANYVSTDWSKAREVANLNKLDFLDIELSTNPDEIYKDVVFAIKNTQVQGKAGIECAIPIIKTLQKIKHLGITEVWSGASADGHFALSRKAIVEVTTKNKKDDPEWLTRFVEKYFARPDPAQVNSMSAFAKSLNINLFAPYADAKVRDIFRGFTWNQMNTPVQKIKVRQAFPELDFWGIGKKHMNLQLGDSLIAKNYEKLLSSKYNTQKSKAVIGIYNQIKKS